MKIPSLSICRHKLDARSYKEELAALFRIFPDESKYGFQKKFKLAHPFIGGLSKSATTHSIPLFSYLFFAHLTAVAERSNATTSQPILSKKTAFTKTAINNQCSSGGFTNRLSTQGFVEPSDHGIQPSCCAAEYNSSNQKEDRLWMLLHLTFALVCS